MRTILYLGVLLSTLTLTACGGGGGGGGVTPVTNNNPSGLYTGTFTQNSVTYNMAGIVYNNRFIGVSVDAGTLYAGNIGVSGNTITGLIDVLIIGGGFDHTTTVNATFVEGVSVTGTTSDAFGTSTFTMNADSIYTRAPNVTLAGTYSYTTGVYTFAVTVANNGTFLGSDTDGCTYSGSQNNFDATHNLYQLVVTVSNCGAANGTYTGYAFNDDISVANDTLIWVIDNPAFVLISAAIRQ